MQSKSKSPTTTWTQSDKQTALYLLFRLAHYGGQRIVMHEDKTGKFNVLNGNDFLVTVLEFVGAIEGRTVAIGLEEFYKHNPLTASFEEQGPLLCDGRPLYGLSFSELPEGAQEWVLNNEVAVSITR